MMMFFKSFKLAFYSLVTNKMRSFLTMLGIIIGVGAVIILVSLMDGMTNEMTTRFEDFGTNAITVTVNNRSGQKKVEPEEMYEFIDENPDMFMGVSPNVSVSNAPVRTTGSDSVNPTVTGVSEEYADISKKVVVDGRFISYGEVLYESRSCVIGSFLKQEIFGSEDAIGKTISLKGYTFTVVGVLEEKADSAENSVDNCVYIPYTTAQMLSGTKNISSYTVGAASEDLVERASDMLEAFLEGKLGDSDYFTVTNLMEILDVVNELLDIMKMMLVAIAGISLLVAGIGIMNIMLVSVTERTREIGIRKSLGAKRRAIMSQFVIEAGVVSGIGGIFGIIVGAIASYAFGNALGIVAIPSVGTIVMAVSVSVGIGVLFGFLPANKAAKLNPIDALRHE